MTERERLIDLINDVKDIYPTIPIINGIRQDSSEVIADHLLSNGVIVPPCKVGDIVWFVRNIGDKSREKITETSIEKVVLKKTGLYIKLDCNSMYETSCNSIGKTVFLTKSQAEEALKNEQEKL